MDFEAYKPRLHDYLRGHGIETGPGNIRCFNPEHDDSTASMKVYDEHFKCFGCGFNGDIYDAAGVLHDEPGQAEQYKIVEQFFGGSFDPSTIDRKPDAGKRSAGARRKMFEIDGPSLTAVTDYLRAIIPQHGDDIAEFSRFRGYPPEYGKYLAWWPGYDIAVRDLGEDVLRAAGIPIPDGEKRSSWAPPGVVCRLGRGLKLQYRRGSETVKRGSYGSIVFAYPMLPESETVILVEGELDTLACRYIGIMNAVGIGGTQGVSVDAARQLHGYKEIITLFDNDDAGHIACEWKPPRNNSAKPVTQIIRESGYEGTIRRALISSEKDVDDLVKNGKADEVFRAIENAEIVYEPEADEVDNAGGNDATNEWIDTPPGEDEPPRAPATGDLPFQFIGYDDRSYYFLPKNQNIPISVGRGNNVLKNWLYEIAPPDWWSVNFTRENADGDPVFDMQAALTWIRTEEYRAGLYNDEHILGTGAHWDKLNGERRIMMNTGQGLIQHGGGVSDYHEYIGKNIYTKARVTLDIDADHWTAADGQRFMHELTTFNFEQNVQYFAVAGYAAIAPFAAALRRRPHIWITGRRGMGKSYLIEELLIPVLGEGYCFYSEGGTTEAAVRQTIGRDSRPVILDEFEAIGKYDRGTLQNIISLARSAYGGAQKVKGSTSHKAISFATKMMFCFASINVNIENEADRSRIVICRMKQSGEERMSPIHNPNGLRARMWRILPKVIDDIEDAKLRVEEGGHDARTCDTYAPLLAGFWNVISDEPFNTGDERFTKMIDVAVKEIGTVETQDDEEGILTHIFDYRITVDGKHERTIWEALTETDDMMKLKYSADVQRYGIHRYDDKDGNEMLAIAAQNPYLSKILETTQFANYKEVLSRNSAVIEKSYPVRVAGKQQRCIVMDWGKVHAKYYGVDDVTETIEGMPF